MYVCVCIYIYIYIYAYWPPRPPVRAPSLDKQWAGRGPAGPVELAHKAPEGVRLPSLLRSCIAPTSNPLFCKAPLGRPVGSRQARKVTSTSWARKRDV